MLRFLDPSTQRGPTMGKIMKGGKVVILLSGRFAGRKGIIVKSNDEGTTDRPYGHCLVAGIDRYPRQVRKGMSKKKIARRTRMKPFVRVVNLNHMMPTRYTVDIGFEKEKVNKETIKNPVKRRKAKLHVKQALEERYDACLFHIDEFSTEVIQAQI
ncbi:60S ribosomal protein L27 [Amphibalanus amphitrite]|uniref:Large ribosomal subunit protein eL27 n=2 Tax=Amphibalanus amphitrite TaxID=1232801 RepID=A0A6A4WGH0_AMPAM|nr:60S ribosomal protein L27 [Amphibalanus amphitrite]